MDEKPEFPTRKVLRLNLDYDRAEPLYEDDRARSEMPTSTGGAPGNLNTVLTTLRKYQRELISQWIDDLATSINDLYDASSDEWKEQDRKLAERGWFPDLDMTIGRRGMLADAIDEESEAVDAYMCDAISDDLDRIETELTKLHHRRARIIADAFEAHRQGKFSLSVCVFISQSEGIIHDAYEKSIFTTDERKKIHRDKTSSSDSPITSQSFYLLSINLPMWLSQKQRKIPFSGLNRHEVLHGITLNYDRQENSLKAISFLKWVSWLYRNSQ